MEYISNARPAHRRKPSCYFEGERRGNRRPDSLSGCQKLSNELLQAPVSVIWVFMYYLMLPRDIFSTWKPRWHLQVPAIAHLKAFDILRENPASDFPVFHLRSSTMVLAGVVASAKYHHWEMLLEENDPTGIGYQCTFNNQIKILSFTFRWFRWFFSLGLSSNDMWMSPMFEVPREHGGKIAKDTDCHNFPPRWSLMGGTCLGWEQPYP